MTIEIPTSDPATIATFATPESDSKDHPVQSQPVLTRQNSTTSPSRANLLAKAAECEPTKFHKIDGWINEDPDDPELDLDVHLQSMITYELMNGADVRVLFRPNLDCDSRIRLLQRLLQEERKIDWDDFDGSSPGPEPRVTKADRAQKQLKTDLLGETVQSRAKKVPSGRCLDS